MTHAHKIYVVWFRKLLYIMELSIVVLYSLNVLVTSSYQRLKIKWVRVNSYARINVRMMLRLNDARQLPHKPADLLRYDRV